MKDGILDATENLVPLEHSPAEIFDAGSGEEQVTLLSENIMLYVKEFGNLTKSNATIDNEYVGTPFHTRSIWKHCSNTMQEQN